MSFQHLGGIKNLRSFKVRLGIRIASGLCISVGAGGQGIRRTEIEKQKTEQVKDSAVL